MNTHRQLGISNTAGAKSMEKLSSGFRINRAGDDAAGLAISEKMRGQIRGLNQASRNAQDGISLIQTAEGALNETHAILQRMRELAVQSATDTNTNDDRKNIQDEVNQLAAEITRISETTEFNTMGLLDGSYDGKKFHIGANEAQNTTIQINDMSARALGVAGNGGPLEVVTSGNGGEYLEVAADVLKADGEVVGVKVGANYYAPADVIKAEGTGVLSVAEGTPTLADLKTGISVDGKIVDYKTGAATDATDIDAAFVTSTTSTPVAFTGAVLLDGSDVVAVQIGGGSGSWYAVGDVQVNAAEDGLEATGTAVPLAVDTAAQYLEASEGGLDVSTQKSADKSITTINTALETVSKERSKLGAMQNRLEHTIKNLDTSAENLQASEARVRDVDMAKEMMEQTKQSILQQAATAMLAQANQAPQTVLQLLR